MSKFLLELGKGFSFVAQQQRFSAGTDHFYIDLVFYNRLLNCFVLFDLKISICPPQETASLNNSNLDHQQAFLSKLGPK